MMLNKKMLTDTKMNALRAKRMYLVDGMDVPEIADVMGTSHKTIYRYLNYSKVILRPRKRDTHGRLQ